MSVNSFMKLLREKQQTKPSPPRSAAVVLSRALPTATSKCDEPPTVCRSQSRLGAGVLMEKIVGLYSKSSGLFFFFSLISNYDNMYIHIQHDVENSLQYFVVAGQYTA